jgi:pheromone shutdown protein TraB
MITLVGIGHVFSIKDAVKYIIHERRPHAVCVELDKFRFDVLEKGLDRSEGAPFLMKRLQKVYDKAASLQGAEVGEEMLGAVEAAKDMGIPHFFIDVEATPMVSGMLQGMSISQKLKLMGSVLGASFLPKKQLEKGMEKIEEDPEKAMEEFGKVFPDLKKRIVDYRDTFMSRKLMKLQSEFPHIVAVIGQGHMSGIREHLKGSTVEVIDLKMVNKIARELKEGRLKLMESSDISGNCSISLSFEAPTLQDDSI